MQQQPNQIAASATAAAGGLNPYSEGWNADISWLIRCALILAVRWAWLVVLLAAAGAALAYFASPYISQKTAKAIILFNAEPPSQVEQEGVIKRIGTSTASLNNQARVVKSFDTAVSALRELRTAGIIAKFDGMGAAAAASQATAQRSPAPSAQRENLTPVAADLSEEDIAWAEFIQRSVASSLGKSDSTIEVKVSTTSEELSAAIANAVVTAYVDNLQVSRQTRLNDIIAASQQQALRMQEKIDEVDANIRARGSDIIASDRNSLQRQINAFRTEYQGYVKKESRAQAQLDANHIEAQVIQWAATPAATRPRLRAIVGGAVVGVFIAAAIIILAFLRATGYRSPSLITEHTGRSVLAVIAEAKSRRLRRSSYTNYVLQKRNSQAAEGLRKLKVSLDLMGVRHTPKIIAVTSSVPNEGKASLASALALTYALAMSQQRVLLIDGDFRYPSVMGELQGIVPATEQKRARMLGSYFLDDCDLQSTVMGTSVERLRVMAHINRHGEFSGEVTDEKVSALLDWAREQHDITIISCPPMAAVAESAMFVSKSDHALMAVRWNKTKPAALRYGLEQMSAINVPVSLVMTRVNISKSAKSDYYEDFAPAHSCRKYYS